MAERHDVLNLIEADMRRMLTIEPGVRISVENDKDVDLLLRIVRESPEVLQSRQSILSGDALAMQQLMLDRIDRMAAATPPAPADTSAKVIHRMRMSAAIERYATAQLNTDANTERTMGDKIRFLRGLCAQLSTLEPALGNDPWVHDIATHHLAAYMDGFVVQTRRRKTALADAGTDTNVRKPATLVKKMSDLNAFFDFAVNELQAANANPTAGLQGRTKNLRSAASGEKQHYLPYTKAHLRRIFEPAAYLKGNTKADYFWAPLLGLLLGARLGELVTLKVSDVSYDAASGVWSLRITPEEAKNDNSVRHLPVTDKLIDLGFLDYVDHVKNLGGTYLFPHQTTESETWKRDPSKNCSRHYGKYLDSIGLTDKLLVFHSFRHTMVTALLDCGAQISDSMQIVGHQAMDTELQTGRIKSHEARSVHLSVYSHPDMPRASVEHPQLRMKALLDACAPAEVDYKQLALAARRVRV